MSEATNKSDIVSGDPFGEIKKDIEGTLETLKQYDELLKSVAKTMREDFGKSQSITIKNIQELNKLDEASKKTLKDKEVNLKTLNVVEQEYQKLLKQEEQTKAKLAVADTRKAKKVAELRAELQAKNKITRDEIKSANEQSNAYKRLERATVAYKNQSKALGAELLELERDGKKNKKAYSDLARTYEEVTKKAQIGDQQLKKLDKTVGDNQRSVGNYEKALGGLKTALGALGIAFGISQIKSFVTGSVDLFRIQEKAVAQVQAGLLSTGNRVGFTLDELKKKAIALQNETLFGDEEILQSVTAQLLTFTNIAGEQFDRTQQAALDLATRLDGDLKSASIQLGKALNDPIKGLSALAKSGIQFSSDQKELIKTLTESGKITEAQTLILDELEKQYGGSAAAAADADGGITQLSNAFNDAREVLGGLIMEGLKPTIKSLKEFFANLDEQKIRAFVNTLGTIVKVTGKLLLVFATYKATIIATNVATKAYIIVTKGAAIAKALLTGNINVATKAMKAFNLTTKMNPLGLLITLLTTAATAFMLFADRASEAERQQRRVNQAIEDGKELGKERSEEIKEQVDTEITELDRLASNRIKNGEDEKVVNAELLQSKKDLIDDKIRLIDDELKANEARISKEVFQLQESKRIALELLEEQHSQGKIRQDQYRLSLSKIDQQWGSKAQKNLRETLSAETQAYRNELRNRRREIQKGYENIEADTVEHEKKLTQDQINAAKKRAADLSNLKRRAEDMEDARISNEYKRREQQLQRAFSREIEAIKGNSEIERRLKTELQLKLDADLLELQKQRLESSKKLVDEALKGEVSDAQAALDERLQAQLKALDREFTMFETNLLKQGLTQEEFDKQLIAEHIRVLEEKLQITKDYGEDTVDLENEIAKLRFATITETNDDFLKTFNDFQQKLTHALEENIDRRIEARKREEDSAKRSQDFFQDLAAQGNINAQQSIAKQIQLEREAIAEQERLRKQKDRLQLISAGLQTFTGEMDKGKSATEAFATTVLTSQALIQFLSSLSGFYKGTDNAPEGWAWVDEKGAEIVTDKKGNIKDIGTDGGARLTYLNKGDKVKTAAETTQLLSQIGNANNKAMISSGMLKESSSNNRIEQLLEKNNRLLENKSQGDLSAEKIGDMIYLTSTSKKLGSVRINRYKINRNA
jgi:hypothetical protein